MKKIIPILLLILVASCKNTWEQEDKDAFKTSCVEDATQWAGSEAKANSYCDCLMEKVMKKYPSESDFIEHAATIAADPDMKGCKTEAMKK